MSGERVLGVDGCRGGWIGVVLERGAEPMIVAARTVAEVVDRASPVAAIGIDIPIHLNENADRPCDSAARRALSPHGSRIFNAPVLAVLRAESYAEASDVSLGLLGKRISKQTWNLVPKIAEVEAWLPSAACPAYEVSPELSFAAMSGHVIATTKKSREGRALRTHALAEQGIVITAAGREL